jgi:hypothetical protein
MAKRIHAVGLGVGSVHAVVLAEIKFLLFHLACYVYYLSPICVKRHHAQKIMYGHGTSDELPGGVDVCVLAD